MAKRDGLNAILASSVANIGDSYVHLDSYLVVRQNEMTRRNSKSTSFALELRVTYRQ
jgi:hypothetical protein